MTTTRPTRGRASERGEGYLRLVIFLAVLVATAYIAFQNLPTYFHIQNFKHELAELVRGLGTINQPIERIQPQVTKLANNYQIAPTDLKIEKNGKTLKVTFNTTRDVDLIVTTYQWEISEVYTQTGY